MGMKIRKLRIKEALFFIDKQGMAGLSSQKTGKNVRFDPRKRYRPPKQALFFPGIVAQLRIYHKKKHFSTWNIQNNIEKLLFLELIGNI
jgi:hypothetical protein